MNKQDSISTLYRNEYSKIVSVLCKTYGISNLQFAEDVVSETFLIATETWKLKGIPKLPKSWLYAVAKNKIKDQFKRNTVFNEKIKPQLLNAENYQHLEPSFSDTNIADSQLQMLFAICNPTISSESQITLALRILCGFGVQEISNAFLSNKQNINKRLGRAKKALRDKKIELSPPSNQQLVTRIDNVLSVIYLLFNEGYYSRSSNQGLKKEMCFEAMRLNYLLLENSFTNLPKVNALMALLCFHSSRFDARTDDEGELVLYADQNKEHWNKELIDKGVYYLSLSTKEAVTKYHLEAGISFWHTKSENSAEKWENILGLYNKLLQIEYSPIIALNRTYVLSKARSKEEALHQALKINLKENHLYHSLLAQLYEGVDLKEQTSHLKTALQLVKTNGERKILADKLKKASREQCI